MNKLEESLTYIKCGTFSTINIGLSGICALGYGNLMAEYNLSEFDTGIAFLLTGAAVVNAFGSYLIRNKCFEKSKESFKQYFIKKQDSNTKISKEDLEKFLND